jgi:hypothetical protein
MAETRVRIPVAVLVTPRLTGRFAFQGKERKTGSISTVPERPVRRARLERHATRRDGAARCGEAHKDGILVPVSCTVEAASGGLCQLTNTRTSTGLAAAEPSIVPEQDTGCLIQLGWIRLTQCPLATLARPDAPPLSLGPEPTQCTDHLKLSCSLFGSVTTSRNARGGRTCEKGAAKVSVGVALWRTISRP